MPVKGHNKNIDELVQHVVADASRDWVEGLLFLAQNRDGITSVMTIAMEKTPFGEQVQHKCAKCVELNFDCLRFQESAYRKVFREGQFPGQPLIDYGGCSWCWRTSEQYKCEANFTLYKTPAAKVTSTDYLVGVGESAMTPAMQPASLGNKPQPQQPHTFWPQTGGPLNPAQQPHHATLQIRGPPNRTQQPHASTFQVGGPSNATQPQGAPGESSGTQQHSGGQ